MWKFKNILKAMTGMFCVVFLVATPVEAAQDSVSVNLQVQQWMKNDSTQEIDNTFEYVLKASEDGNPMPGGNADGSFLFFMTGNQKIELEEMSYTKPGIYRYEVFQNIQEKQKGYEYDDRHYSIEIYVKNASVGGLQATVIIKNEQGEKCECLEFTNRYQEKLTPGDSSSQLNTGENGKPVKTGDVTEIRLWIFLMAGSICMIFVLVAFYRRVEKRTEKH